MAKKISITPEMQEHAVSILDRICTLSKKKTAATSKRKNLFTERDTVAADIEDADEGDLHELYKRAYEVGKQIEKLAVDIKFFGDEIDLAVEDCEQGKFEFLEGELTPPKELYDKLKPKKHEEPAEKDERPVGIPDDKNQLKMSHAPGVDEHLKADVKELNLNDRTTDKLVNAGLKTIGDIAKILDATASNLGAVMDAVDCGQEVAGNIIKAVKSYRAKHRKVMLEKEREKGGVE